MYFAASSAEPSELRKEGKKTELTVLLLFLLHFFQTLTKNE